MSSTDIPRKKDEKIFSGEKALFFDVSGREKGLKRVNGGEKVYISEGVFKDLKKAESRKLKAEIQAAGGGMIESRGSGTSSEPGIGWFD